MCRYAPYLRTVTPNPLEGQLGAGLFSALVHPAARGLVATCSSSLSSLTSTTELPSLTTLEPSLLSAIVLLARLLLQFCRPRFTSLRRCFKLVQRPGSATAAWWQTTAQHSKTQHNTTLHRLSSHAACVPQLAVRDTMHARQLAGRHCKACRAQLQLKWCDVLPYDRATAMSPT